MFLGLSILIFDYVLIVIVKVLVSEFFKIGDGDNYVLYFVFFKVGDDLGMIF